MNLSANQERSEMEKKRLEWEVEGPPPTGDEAMRGGPIDPAKLVVELGPMEIRTFLLDFDHLKLFGHLKWKRDIWVKSRHLIQIWFLFLFSPCYAFFCTFVIYQLSGQHSLKWLPFLLENFSTIAHLVSSCLWITSLEYNWRKLNLFENQWLASLVNFRVNSKNTPLFVVNWVPEFLIMTIKYLN